MTLTRALHRGSFLILAVIFSLDSQAAASHSNWKAFIGGALTTLAVHEASHYFLAKQYRFDVDFSAR